MAAVDGSGLTGINITAAGLNGKFFQATSDEVTSAAGTYTIINTSPFCDLVLAHGQSGDDHHTGLFYFAPHFQSYAELVGSTDEFMGGARMSFEKG